ncbi:hypothetical protein HRbin08_00295 [bacterium HR08]|nr:hypothetical protein HRbin08_00295 [bacterium HR08]
MPHGLVDEGRSMETGRQIVRLWRKTDPIFIEGEGGGERVSSHLGNEGEFHRCRSTE